MLEERKRVNVYRNLRKAGIQYSVAQGGGGRFDNTSMRSCSRTFVLSTPIQTN